MKYQKLVTVDYRGVNCPDTMTVPGRGHCRNNCISVSPQLGKMTDGSPNKDGLERPATGEGPFLNQVFILCGVQKKEDCVLQQWYQSRINMTE